jgi:hypothetical protein
VEPGLPIEGADLARQLKTRGRQALRQLDEGLAGYGVKPARRR